MMTTGKTRRTRGCGIVLTSFLAVGLGMPSPARADGLGEGLLKKAAPQVVAYLRDKGYNHVGVLKFLVKRGDEAASDHVGELNLRMADRLEVALELADKNERLNIIHNASAVAAHLPGANHLTKEGRRAFFQGQYSLAWGDDKVSVDAFLTGRVTLQPDLKKMAVAIQCFGKDGDLKTVASLSGVPVSTTDLLEAGESFLLRGAFDKGTATLTDEQTIASAVLVKDDQEKYPLADEKAPVGLGIFYDGNKVPLEIRDGKAQVPGPMEGQAVSFVLENTGNQRYGVVLKVNGLNTLYEQRLPDLECRKWVLDPGDKMTVEGFQTEGASAKKFKVSPLPESRQHEINYGNDVGTIGLTVFREAKESVPLVDEDEVLATTRGVFAASKYKSRDQLKTALLLQATAFRNLIEAGAAEIDSKFQKVTFKPDPNPVMLATIVYYQKNQ